MLNAESMLLIWLRQRKQTVNQRLVPKVNFSLSLVLSLGLSLDKEKVNLLCLARFLPPRTCFAWFRLVSLATPTRAKPNQACLRLLEPSEEPTNQATFSAIISMFTRSIHWLVSFFLL